MGFNERFKQSCKENGISPTALLKKLKISTSKLTAWNNGSMPNSEFLIPISESLGVSIDYLLKGNEIPASQNTVEKKQYLELFELLETYEQREVIAFIQGILSTRKRNDTKENQTKEVG